MRAIVRVALSAPTLKALQQQANRVAAAADPSAEAAGRWDNKPKKAFDEVRDALRRMARGRERCMYCEDSEGTDIEHFWPKTPYPHLAFCWENYLLACSHCNSNQKRDRFPLTDGRPDLIDPSVEDPAEHLDLVPTSGAFRAVGPKGQPSIDVFDLNGDLGRKILPQGRRDTLRKLQLLLLAYDGALAAGDGEDAAATRETILREPFTAVLVYLVKLAQNPRAALVLRPGVADVIVRRGVEGWIA